MLFDAKPCMDGVQLLHRFENGYGLSVVRHSGAYCDLKGKGQGSWTHPGGPVTFEVGVIRWGADDDWNLVTDMDPYRDVFGWKTSEEVEALSEEVAGLPAWAVDRNMTVVFFGDDLELSFDYDKEGSVTVKPYASVGMSIVSGDARPISVGELTTVIEELMTVRDLTRRAEERS